MSYLYETHLHTVQGSACAVSPGRDYVKRYRDLGYTGVIVTDHFFNGNSAIDRDLPWAEWVNQFCRGYEDARNEGAKIGLDVFFGWEETFKGDDYLIYGLDKEWLLRHPEAARWSRRAQFDGVRAAGGCVVQAHPFRAASYIRTIHLSTGCVDAVEAANAGNAPAFDILALRYAKRLGLPVTAGSDIHYAGDIASDVVFGVYLDNRMETIHDYVRAIRENSIAALRVPNGRWDSQGDVTPSLPVDIRDADDKGTWQDFWEFLGA
ncbi:hypothetical protein AGMMS50267_03960 [Spirochaetia bacterium]|nr:hypothetical protein AGMMS50267_03960 [Spirochaetia bacterium]